MGISTKKFLIVVLSLTLLFLVGCGDKPTDSGNEKKSSPYAGVWEGGGQKITINSDGSFNIDGQNIPANSITQNGNTFSFKNPADGTEYSLTFKSDTEAEFKKNGEQIPLTKNPESGGGGSSGNDIDNQLNALFNSIPALFNADATDAPNGTYTGDFTLTDSKDAGDSKNEHPNTKNISLTIENNKITKLSIKDYDTSSFKVAQIKTDNGKYNAISEFSSDMVEGVAQKLNYYIEFTKDNDTTIKDIKFIQTFSVKGAINNNYQETYTCKTLTSLSINLIF